MFSHIFINLTGFCLFCPTSGKISAHMWTRCFTSLLHKVNPGLFLLLSLSGCYPTMQSTTGIHKAAMQGQGGPRGIRTNGNGSGGKAPPHTYPYVLQVEGNVPDKRLDESLLQPELLLSLVEGFVFNLRQRRWTKKDENGTERCCHTQSETSPGSGDVPVVKSP